MGFVDNLQEYSASRESLWDSLLSNRSIGRMALRIRPSQEHIDELKPEAERFVARDDEFSMPPGWTDEWREFLVKNLAFLMAAIELPGDWFPAFDVPRFTHGQSQGICDLFGAEVIKCEDGLMYVNPLPPDPVRIREIEPGQISDSMYYGAVEYIGYARRATGGVVGFRNPVMTSPFDTANYLLGSTVLLEWVYMEPDALHSLLAKLTDLIIETMKAIRSAAGGVIHGDALSCMRGAFCLCSECRSLVSSEIYEEFEAPYLRRIGEALGPYGIHACGSWERTVESGIRDPNMRAMNGQVRENDLSLLCEIAAGRMTFSIGRSVNLHERYTWPDVASYYSYLVENTPADQPMESGVSEKGMSLCSDMGLLKGR